VLTSIEGVFKRELQKRTIYIPYGVRLNTSHGDRDYIEDQIADHRDEMLSALCHVLKRFLAMGTPIVVANSEFTSGPFSEFSGYMRQLAKLLHAYGAETGRPNAWADKIVRTWSQTLGQVSRTEEDELESHIVTVLTFYEAVREKSEQVDISPQQRSLLEAFERIENYSHGEEVGTLYITTAGKLLNAMNLNRIGFNAVPKTAQAMGRRLEKVDCESLKVLDESHDCRLIRKSNQRPIGIFRPNENESSLRPDLPMTLGGLEHHVSQ
jgi:hypothetical protein